MKGYSQPGFTLDTRIGSLPVHRDTPQCCSTEMYSVDLNILGKPKDDKSPPISARNQFFRIPLTDFAQASSKCPYKPSKVGGDKSEFISESINSSAVNEADYDILYSLNS